MKKLILLLICCTTACAAEFKAGIARVVITPELPFWLSGYASRNRPADAVVHELWAKALALEDANGNRAVIVTTDLIGLPRQVSDAVADRVQNQHKLSRAQLLLSSSHTHSGPAVRPNLSVMFDFGPEDIEKAERYAKQLADSLVRIVGEAIANLEPAKIYAGHGKTDFAINRREPVPNGMRIGLNPAGPVDYDVPVVKITDQNGKLRAVLFGYACHNTTLGGDFYKICGDYSGFAQIELERAHPDVTAFFVILCGGDQNPNPRGTLELAEQHGKTLAAEVNRVLASELHSIQPALRTAFKLVALEFAPHSRAAFEKEAQSQNRFRQRRAKLMLEAYDAGRPILKVDLPVQVVRLGADLVLLALGGEVVVDYPLRIKRELPDEDLIVAGYCNDVMCYIPSRRVIHEGGYESVDSMIYYGQPGPFADSIEETIVENVRQLVASTRQSKSK